MKFTPGPFTGRTVSAGVHFRKTIRFWRARVLTKTPRRRRPKRSAGKNGGVLFFLVTSDPNARYINPAGCRLVPDVRPNSKTTRETVVGVFREKNVLTNNKKPRKRRAYQRTDTHTHTRRPASTLTSSTTAPGDQQRSATFGKSISKRFDGDIGPTA